MTLSSVDFCHSSASLSFNHDHARALFLYVVLQQMLFGATKGVVEKIVSVLMAHLEPGSRSLLSFPINVICFAHRLSSLWKNLQDLIIWLKTQCTHCSKQEFQNYVKMEPFKSHIWALI